MEVFCHAQSLNEFAQDRIADPLLEGDDLELGDGGQRQFDKAPTRFCIRSLCINIDVSRRFNSSLQAPFDPEGELGQPPLLEPPDVFTAVLDKEQQHVLGDLEARNGKRLDSEIEKFDRCTEDLKLGLEQEILDVWREFVAAAGLPHKLEHQGPHHSQGLARTSSLPKMRLRCDAMLADIDGKLTQQQTTPLFTIRRSLT
ncbi:MAG: hypothetical protein WDN23_13350 [Edaphobacter sp.]